MKALIATLALLALAAPATAGPALVNVHFYSKAGVATPSLDATETLASCDLVVPRGSDGGNVLAAAVAAGCIDAWTSCVGDYGRFVTSIDGVWGDGVGPDGGDCAPSTNGPALGTGMSTLFWAIEHNGTAAPTGIDGYRAAEGDRYGFVYTTWLTFLVP